MATEPRSKADSCRVLRNARVLPVCVSSTMPDRLRYPWR